MPITPFIDGMSFDPETRRVIGVAFEMTCTALHLSDRGDRRLVEDTPNEKTAAEGVKIFTPGSRKDVKPRAGAFLLAELDRADGEQEANQQFYFSPVKGNRLSFRFIAAWKAHGELKLGADSTATGFINQKSHITELTCTIRTR